MNDWQQGDPIPAEYRDYIERGLDTYDRLSREWWTRTEVVGAYAGLGIVVER